MKRLLLFLSTILFLHTIGAHEPVNPNYCKLLLKAQTQKAVNIVIMGDGFTATDINNGTYDRVVSEIMNKFFYVPPFQQFKPYFNVYIVYAVSRDRGADDKPGQDIKDTVFNSTFGANGIERYLILQNFEALNQYTAYATANPHARVVLVNDSRYGGTGGSYSIISLHNNTFGVFMHEMGHTLGKLADEYIDEASVPLFDISQVAYKANVDTANSSQSVKWSYMIGKKGYESVGLYEGAYYRSKGVYRPQANCMMRTSSHAFCHVCREQISKEICKILSINYRFDSFYSFDPVWHRDDEICIYSPINYQNRSIGDYYNASNTTTTSTTSSTTNDYNYDDCIRYVYHSGFFAYTNNYNWVGKSNSGKLYYYTQYKSDDSYYYLQDSTGKHFYAMPRNGNDLYYWRNNQWEFECKVYRKEPYQW